MWFLWLGQVSTGGSEIGQGLYTKVAQSVAYSLGVPLTMITVSPTRTDDTPSDTVTGGSTTSEACVIVSGVGCVVCQQALGKRGRGGGRGWYGTFLATGLPSTLSPAPALSTGGVLCWVGLNGWPGGHECVRYLDHPAGPD